MYAGYTCAVEIVIGLEIHVQLATRTKLFCPCRADYFEAPPNTLTCPVCLGLPGALPVLNKRAVELALRIALALEAQVQERAVFDRKNYFYPDLPKGYQITHHDEPLARGGRLTFFVDGAERTVRIRQVHLEEDAGKLVHVGDGALVDFNRCGVPLVEIVTEPDFRSPKEARLFLQELRTLLRHLRVSSGDMEKGALRCDANLSVTMDGRPGTRTEIKNLNSFRAVERALEAAAEFHRTRLLAGEAVDQVTFGWDDHADRLVVQRSKEQAQDYRYFPDPDLVPLVVSRDWLGQVRAAMPELPRARARRWSEGYGLAPAEVEALLPEPELADYFDRVAQALGDGKTAASWVLAELRQYWTGEEPPVPAEDLVLLIRKVAAGEISRTTGKELLAEAVQTKKSLPQLLAQPGLAQVADEETLVQVAREVLAAHPQAVADFQAGKGQALGFLVGQAMKKTQGRADAKKLAEILRKLLAS